MDKNQIDQKLKALALRMSKYQHDMKLTQAQVFRWTAIRQQKDWHATRSNHLKHWTKMGMRHLMTLKKKMKNIRTEVIGLSAIKKEATT